MCGNRYFFTFSLGAVAGGMALAWATKAMPRMRAKMMRKMMAEMAKEGCNAEDM